MSTKNCLWISQDDALYRLQEKNFEPEVSSAIQALIKDGVAIIKNANSAELCDEVIKDYMRYVEENADYVKNNLDVLNREKRLVNFHLFSEASGKIATNPIVMKILDCIFDLEAGVYTSLTFKYGTQQPVHRDTPHFATWPQERFAGVWTALEDINKLAGPLFYHPGAHKFSIDPKKYIEEARVRLPNANIEEQLLMALDLYNGEVIRTAPKISESKLIELQKGDTVIWHPELPHGGSAAADPFLTRWSMVTHCSPVNIQVHQHDKFFLHCEDNAPLNRYDYFEMNGRKIANSGNISFM
jgi:phytanoyl-CoA hydroxylase